MSPAKFDSGTSRVGIALGHFVTSCLIRGMGLTDFPGVGFAGHYDQG